MKKTLSFSQWLYIIIFLGLIILFFTMPIVQFGGDLLREIFTYTGINLPTLSTKTWSLYNIQQIIGDVKEVIVLVDDPEAQTALTILTVARVLFWLIPILLGIAFIVYLLRWNGFSKFLGFFGLLINFLIVGLFGLIRPLTSSSMSIADDLIFNAIFKISDLVYIYLVIIFIGFIILVAAKRKKS